MFFHHLLIFSLFFQLLCVWLSLCTIGSICNRVRNWVRVQSSPCPIGKYWHVRSIMCAIEPHSQIPKTSGFSNRAINIFKYVFKTHMTHGIYIEIIFVINVHDTCHLIKVNYRTRKSKIFQSFLICWVLCSRIYYSFGNLRVTHSGLLNVLDWIQWDSIVILLRMTTKWVEMFKILK